MPGRSTSPSRARASAHEALPSRQAAPCCARRGSAPGVRGSCRDTGAGRSRATQIPAAGPAPPDTRVATWAGCACLTPAQGTSRPAAGPGGISESTPSPKSSARAWLMRRRPRSRLRGACRAFGASPAAGRSAAIADFAVPAARPVSKSTGLAARQRARSRRTAGSRLGGACPADAGSCSRRGSAAQVREALAGAGEDGRTTQLRVDRESDAQAMAATALVNGTSPRVAGTAPMLAGARARRAAQARTVSDRVAPACRARSSLPLVADHVGASRLPMWPARSGG